MAPHQEIKQSADENLEIILKSTGEPDDLISHRIEDTTETYAVVVYLETLVDSNLLGRHVIEPINKFIQVNNGANRPESIEVDPIGRQID